MTYYELSPAYGRDYKTKADVIRAWQSGKDFQGDYSLSWAIVNINDIPKPCTVNLRYKGLRNIAVVKVPVGVVADPTSDKPIGNPRVSVTPRPPSVSTMQRWMLDGVAKATDGCEVEPDGRCEHGCDSWLLKMGVI
jgi:hypothetical protein